MRLLVSGGAGYVGSSTSPPGDPAILVASAGRSQSDLGWQAHRDLRAMVTDVWQFTQAQFTHGRE